MIFTTSPVTPWRGYRTGPALGAAGGHAACGGVHGAADDPWIETRVTGPGIVRFAMARTASDAAAVNGGVSPFEFPLKVTVNGADAILHAPASPGMPEVFVAAGTHSVRWMQHGSQVLRGNGELAWLDQVSFTPSPAVSWREALESGTRSWSMGGGPEGVTPASWPPSAVGGTSVIFTPHPGTSPSLSTMVKRPCLIRYTGTDVRLSTPEGILYEGWGETYGDKYVAVPGNGPGTVTFTAREGRCAVLDHFAALTELPLMDTGEASWGRNPVWHLVSRSMSWLGNSDDPADPLLATPERSRGRHYLEAVIHGPCSFSRDGVVFLPERNMRTAVNRLTFPGPQRVIMEPKGETIGRNIIQPLETRPGISPGMATGAPDLAWETGGDVPWMGETAPDGAPLHAVAGNLLGGEVSWIETRVTGPGVLRWRMGAPYDGSADYGMLWNGVPVWGWVSSPVQIAPGAGYLHLPAGENRIRWRLSTDAAGPGTSQRMTLSNVAFEAAPSPSLQDFTGASEMAFLVQRGQAPGDLPPWSSLEGWKADTVEGRSVLKVAVPLWVMPISRTPGDFTVVAKADYPGGGSLEHGSSFHLAPYPWLPRKIEAPAGIFTTPLFSTGRGITSVLPEGAQLLVDSAEFAAAGEVDLAEALDTPGLIWTTGATGSAGWRGFSGHGAGWGTDPDAAYCRGLNVGETAWMETQLTGPAKVRVTGSIPSGESSGATVWIDGEQATLPMRNLSGGSDKIGFYVPPGPHRVRLAWSPTKAFSGALSAILSNVTVTPESPTDIGALVEAPELNWQAVNVMLTAETADTFDGTDALRFASVSLNPAITTTVEGPGLLSARIKGSASILMDETEFRGGNSSTYSLSEVAVPNGRHVIRFVPVGPVLLDAVHFQPLPALTAAEALDSPLGGFEPADSPGYAAGAFPNLARDRQDCVILYPGRNRRILLPLPVPCQVSFYVKFMTVSGLFKYGDKTISLPSSGNWTPVSFESDTVLLPDGRLSLEASGGPVHIDNMTISPSRGDYYLSWAASFGLTGSRAAVNADPDGDGMENLLERAFGSDPTRKNNPSPGTATQPGMPVLTTGWDPGRLEEVLELYYWTRAKDAAGPDALDYTVETAGDPFVGSFAGGAAAGWRASPAAPSVLGQPVNGWTRMLWRSPDLISESPRNFVRLRIRAN